jgi:hypothetical protein
MGTFYLGLSMAGTVSAGTYTAGTLVEINKWLEAFQKARAEGVKLKAVRNAGPYKAGDLITFSKEEIPSHYVKIKALTGTSGGGVSAALYLSGLTTNNVEKYLKEKWLSFDVMEMLDRDDLAEKEPFFSVLNVKPIDRMVEEMKKEKFGPVDHAKSLEYLADDIELFLTLASYAGMPYDAAPATGENDDGKRVSYGVYKSHMDYIKFNFSKNGNHPQENPLLPYAHKIQYNANQAFRNDRNWELLLNSCPATAAFPIGFRPRKLARLRKEYNGKLFYMDYTNPKENEFLYSSLKPYWEEAGGEQFEMVYIDGGTFNRESHDLNRASILQTLELGKSIDPNGIKTNACIVLIDPFASNPDKKMKPGQINEEDNSTIKKIPELFSQPGYILGAMTDHGRFRPDWVEKALDDKYYSRYLITPIRRDVNNNREELALAAGLLSAFSGFFDEQYRQHDYNLGRYNTWKFLCDHFQLPKGNTTVDYYTSAGEDLKQKYEAVGWYNPKDQHCQLIPRMREADIENTVQPQWKKMSRARWAEVCDKAEARIKLLAKAATDLPPVADGLVDFGLWALYLKKNVRKMLEKVEKELEKYKMIENDK